MYIVQLTRINFKNRPDEQTVSYAKRIPEWMSQWTVKNNYAPLLCADLEEGLREVQGMLADQFWGDMNSAVSELLKRPKAEHLADFSFDYTLHSGGPGLKTVYHGTRNFEYFELLPQRDPLESKDHTEQYTGIRQRLIDAFGRALPADCASLLVRYRETWSPDMIFDELGADGAAVRRQLGEELEKAFGSFYPKLYTLDLGQAVIFLYEQGVRV